MGSTVGYVLANGPTCTFSKKRNAMREQRLQPGRHRLGTAGGVHCLEIPAVASALAEHRRTWLTAMISQGKHSFASMRKRSEGQASSSSYWIPVTAN
jgi:hypothetical protein